MSPDRIVTRDLHSLSETTGPSYEWWSDIVYHKISSKCTDMNTAILSMASYQSTKSNNIIIDILLRKPFFVLSILIILYFIFGHDVVHILSMELSLPSIITGIPIATTRDFTGDLYRLPLWHEARYCQHLKIARHIIHFQFHYLNVRKHDPLLLQLQISFIFNGIIYGAHKNSHHLNAWRFSVLEEEL